MPKKATATATAKTAPKAAKSADPKAQSDPGPKSHSAPAKAGATTKKTTAKKAAPAATTATAARTAGRAAKEVSKTVVPKKAEATATKKPAAAPKAKAKGDRAAFFAKQRELLLEERQTYISSAEALKAQADSLALEHEPGDVQFDEEGGEGGTANVDREIDLYLSAQARATVVEIDRALQKIEDGTYGVCEQCGQAIPDARLQALPFAALCVTCKSGGLSSRR
jgi:DnaK suppressor protein